MIVIVLVRCEGARNAGSVARLCGNFGAELRFVSTTADLSSKDALQMAHPCEQLLHDALHFTSVNDAVADCALAVATSGKIDEAMRGPPLDVDQAARLRPAVGDRLAVVFGNERTGLAKDEADVCARTLRLPTPGPVDSLNLASAVAVTLTLLSAKASTETRASASSREALLQTLSTALSARGFFKNGNTPERMRPRLQELVDKMDLSPRDVALLGDLLRCLGGLE